MTFDGSSVALLAAAGGIFLLVLALGLFELRRSRRAATNQVSAVVDEVELRLGERMNELVHLLTKSEQETRRARLLGELSTSLELEEVLDRLLHAACELSGANGAVVSVAEPPGDKTLVRSLGVDVAEAEELEVGASPDGRVARAISIRYRFSEHDGNNSALLRSALAVPLVYESELLGHLAVYSHEVDEASEETLAQIEELTARAAPMIENARRFREARLLADMDSLTGLHNHRYFHEALAREVRRAHRYGRVLSLLVLDADLFKAVNDRIGHLGGDEFAVILPESGLLDAEQLAERIQEAVSALPIGEAGIVRFSAGVAELQDREDAPALFERADHALYRAKAEARGELGDPRYGATSA